MVSIVRDRCSFLYFWLYRNQRVREAKELSWGHKAGYSVTEMNVIPSPLPHQGHRTSPQEVSL